MNQVMGEKELLLSLRAQGATAVEARELVALAGALALAPEPEIDAAFADALEARLLTEGLEESPNVTPLRPSTRPAPARPVVARPAAPAPVRTIATVTPLPRRRFVIRKTLAAAVAAVLIMALPVAAGANALPSSPAYPVKMAMEDLRMRFTGGALAKGFYQLNLAGVRLEEAAQELALGNDAVAAKTVARMKAYQARGSKMILGAEPSAADLQRVESTLRGYARELAGLLPQAGSTATPRIIETIRAGEAWANKVAAQLGGPVAPALVLPAKATADPAAISSGSSSSQRSSGTTDASTKPDSRSVDEQAREDANERVHNAAQGGCQVPGSANGLGEVLAPAAKVICGR